MSSPITSPNIPIPMQIKYSHQFRGVHFTAYPLNCTNRTYTTIVNISMKKNSQLLHIPLHTLNYLALIFLALISLKIWRKTNVLKNIVNSFAPGASSLQPSSYELCFAVTPGINNGAVKRKRVRIIAW